MTDKCQRKKKRFFVLQINFRKFGNYCWGNIVSSFPAVSRIKKSFGPKSDGKTKVTSMLQEVLKFRKIESSRSHCTRETTDLT